MPETGCPQTEVRALEVHPLAQPGPRPSAAGVRQRIASILQPLGIDAAVFYTLTHKGWDVLAAAISISLVSILMSPSERGYYFAFNSVLVLRYYLDTALSYVILQFSSHEAASLRWNDAGILEGNPIGKARLSSLFRAAQLWYGAICIVLLAVILPGGLIFFQRHGPPEATSWKLPWALMVSASAVTLFLSPLLALLEGSGRVTEISRYRVGESLASSSGLWAALLTRWGMFAAPVLPFIAGLYRLTWIIQRKRVVFMDLMNFRYQNARISWWKEVWPFQWRTSFSLFTGQMVLQLCNPLLFASHGAVASGQMGVSLSIAGAISALALSWVSTKAPRFGHLVAEGNFDILNRLFSRSLFQSLLVAGIGCVLFQIATMALSRLAPGAMNRLLPPVTLSVLLVGTLSNHVALCQGYYVRATKNDPFVWIALAYACAVFVTASLLVKPYSHLGMVASYTGWSAALNLPLCSYIFWKQRCTLVTQVSDSNLCIAIR